MYLLDTNTLIYFFKGMGQVASHLLKEHPQNIAVAAITLYELEVGIRKSSFPNKRMQQLQDLVTTIKIIPFGYEEAQYASQLRANLEKQGNSIGPLDNLIAGSAIAHQATLVTHNIKEFKRVKNLKLTDWY